MNKTKRAKRNIRGINMQKINLNFCSFCRKVPRDAQIMIMGPDGINLCDECVDLCVKIIAERMAKNNQPLNPDGKKA